MLSSQYTKIKCVSCETIISIDCTHLVAFCPHCNKAYVTKEVTDGTYLKKEALASKLKAQQENIKKTTETKNPNNRVKLSSIQMASAKCPSCDMDIEINYMNPVGICKYCQKPYLSKEVMAGTAKKMPDVPQEIKVNSEKSETKNKTLSSIQMASAKCPSCDMDIEINYMHPVGFCKYCQKPYISKEVMAGTAVKVKDLPEKDIQKPAINSKTLSSIQMASVNCPVCKNTIEINYMYPVGFCKYCRSPYITKDLLDKLGIKPKNATEELRVRPHAIEIHEAEKLEMPIKKQKTLTPTVHKATTQKAVTPRTTIKRTTVSTPTAKKVAATVQSLNVPKRPRGRPRKDGTPPGSPRIAVVKKAIKI